jgi:DNA-binding IclR family transcriptional regulator
VAGNANLTGRSVVSKVAAIMHCFDASTHLTLSEVARLTALPLSTSYRLVSELVASDILRRTPQGHYTLPGRVDVMARPGGTSGRALIRDAAQPVLRDLLAVTRRTVRLAIRDGLRLRYIDHSAQGATPADFDQHETLPLHATAMGKVLLAFSPAEVVAAVIDAGLMRYTPDTITDPDRLRNELITIRRTNNAANWGEFDVHSSGLAVGIVGGGEFPVGALGLRIASQHEVASLHPALLIASRVISRTLVTAAPRQHADSDSR